MRNWFRIDWEPRWPAFTIVLWAVVIEIGDL